MQRSVLVASRLFREKGFDAVSVSEVMKAAGLTHGGFYGHFNSKDDLVAETVGYVLSNDGDGGGDLRAYLDEYFRPDIGTTLPLAVPRRALPRIFATRHRLPARP